MDQRYPTLLLRQMYGGKELERPSQNVDRVPERAKRRYSPVHCPRNLRLRLHMCSRGSVLPAPGIRAVLR